jgi:hypothetical protein
VKWQSSLLALALLGSPSLAQDAPLPVPGMPVVPVWSPGPDPVVELGTPPVFSSAAENGSGFLTGNKNFSNFIGFMSNPLQSIDPRALTQIAPLFLGNWINPEGRLPSADTQVYGPAITIALSDRLAVGINQGGYANAHFNNSGPSGRFASLLNDALANRGINVTGGDRSGFLNTGGFAQYTFLQDVEHQFLATGGLRVVVPMGSYEIFQGKGPVVLAPYLTLGKEFGEFHFLATGGYQFPTHSGDRTLELFYLNAHIDRQVCGWIYPLFELNWIYHTSSVNLGDLDTRFGYIDFGTFQNTGNLLDMAAGVNLVLIRDRLEFGAVYTTPIATQNKFNFNGVLVKLLFRY